MALGDRSQGQLPFSSMASPRRHDDRTIADFQQWLADNYASAHPVTLMTGRSGLNERTFCPASALMPDRVEIDSNIVERAVRPQTIIRKIVSSPIAKAVDAYGRP